MSFPRSVTRADEKLGAILAEVKRLRGRLNSLAIQRALFGALASIIAAVALIFAAAYLLSPLAFVLAAAAIAICAVVICVRAIGSGWAMLSSASKAAEIADYRASLKGRLTTVVQMASRRHRGSLWPYVLEDALSYRDDFAASRIERRRIERSLWALLASSLIAALLIPLARSHRRLERAHPGPPAEITMNLNDLHLRPADPGDADAPEVQADAATMQKLQAKLAREGYGAGAGAAQNGIVDRARKIASDVQSKLRGDTRQKPRLTLKLADSGEDRATTPGGGDWAMNHPEQQSPPAGQFEPQHGDEGRDMPMLPTDNSTPRDQLAQHVGGPGGVQAPSAGGSNAQDLSATPQDTADASSSQGSGGGPSHGVGADPDSLFGAASNSKMGNEGFEISIQARPIEHGAKGTGQAYMPPKVRTPLNHDQHPDEPIARATVPASDRTTIQRVFER